MNNDIYVYIEHEDNKIKDVSLELINKANELKIQRPNLDINIVSILIGEKVTDLAKECIYFGSDKVIKYEHKLLKDYDTSVYAKVIAEIVKAHDPEAFLIGGTITGRDLAPRISARLQTGLTADATSIEFNPDDESSKELWITRPAFGGNLYATIICPNNRPQMATIRSNVFEQSQRDTTRVGEIILFDNR